MTPLPDKKKRKQNIRFQLFISGLNHIRFSIKLVFEIYKDKEMTHSIMNIDEEFEAVGQRGRH